MNHRTLIDALLYIGTGLEFNGKFNSHKNCGCIIILKTGDTEEHLVSNWMQTGAGFHLTTEIVTEHFRSEGKCEVSRYCVMSSFYCMNPQNTTTRKIVSGGNNDEWINARGNHTKQLMIMLGKLTEEKITTNAEVLRLFRSIPPWFDPTLLPKLIHTQITQWDECHIEQQTRIYVSKSNVIKMENYVMMVNVMTYLLVRRINFRSNVVSVSGLQLVSYLAKISPVACAVKYWISPTG